MLVWEVRYKVVTPMFLGGADPDKNNQLKIRLPSIKGALRFWYRAVTLERLGSIEEVRKREAKLFGSAETGQGAFLLRVSTKKEDKPRNPAGAGMGLDYLGYGLHKKDEPHFMKKNFIKQGTIIELKFIFKKNITNKCDITKMDLNDLKLAVKALGFFGGLGARSRRGFGSLTLLSLMENGQEIWRASTDKVGLVEEYKNFFKELQLKPRVEQLPDYTAFTDLCKCVISMEENDPLKLLNKTGMQLSGFRKNNSKLSTDLEIAYKVVNKKFDNEQDSHPVKVAFGLPHNYKLPKAKNSKVLEINSFVNQQEYKRASPLFIHIHQIGSKYLGVFLFLPAKFLPPNMHINMTAINEKKEKTNVVKVPNAIEAIGNFTPITDFLNEICQAGDGEEVAING